MRFFVIYARATNLQLREIRYFNGLLRRVAALNINHLRLKTIKTGRDVSKLENGQ